MHVKGEDFKTCRSKSSDADRCFSSDSTVTLSFKLNVAGRRVTSEQNQNSQHH